MQILVNSKKVDIQDVRSNGGKVIDFVYMNRVLVWQRMLTINLGQQSKTFNLRSYINAHNPKNVKQIAVVNDRVQPSMESGNLSGLEVTFINGPKGELRGTSIGHTALHVTSKMTLINNGWIRGTGGNGKNGSAGGRGASGSKGSTGARGANAGTKKVSYTVPKVVSWPANFSFRHGETKYGWSLTTKGCNMGGTLQSLLRSPCGQTKCILRRKRPSFHPATFPCGARAHGGGAGGGGWNGVITIMTAGSVTVGTTTKYHNIPGGNGGAGGAGGAGGSGGNGGAGGIGGVGQSFTTTRTDGTPGKSGTSGRGGSNGKAGSLGSINSAVLNGTRYYGYRGGKGKTGGRGSTGKPGSRGTAGGNGGRWGKAGGNGGGHPGDAISGKRFLTSGSNTGKTNGSIK